MHLNNNTRDTFLRAVELFYQWSGRGAPPKVEHYDRKGGGEVKISMLDACHLVWRCTDTLPGDEAHILATDCEGMKTSSYAAGAQALATYIRRHV